MYGPLPALPILRRDEVERLEELAGVLSSPRMLRVRHLEFSRMRRDRDSGYGRTEGFLRQVGLCRERNTRLGRVRNMSTWDLYEWGRP